MEDNFEKLNLLLEQELCEFMDIPDGTVTEFTAQVAVKRTGGAVNGVIEFELSMAVQSDFKYTDPA